MLSALMSGSFWIIKCIVKYPASITYLCHIIISADILCLYYSTISGKSLDTLPILVSKLLTSIV